MSRHAWSGLLSRSSSVFLIGVSLAFIVPAVALAGGTGWPGGVWEPASPTYGMTVVSGVSIEMDDGVILHANVGYPADPVTGLRAPGEFPVLLTQNPYTGGGNPDPFFVTRGYIHAVTEVRGTGLSELSAANPNGPLANEFRGERDALDGALLVDWAAELDGSNGRVGLNGCSWLGINQIMTAGQLSHPTAVKAMVPACAEHSYQSYFVGGVPTAVVALFGAPIPLTGLKHFAENIAFGTALRNDILGGGERALDGNWWAERSTYLQVEQIVDSNIPTLLWTNWNAQDGVTGGVDLYAALQNAQKNRPTYGPMKVQPFSSSGKFQIIVGPGGHGQGLDKSLQLLWYDHWVKGQDTRIDEVTTGMHMFELGADRWVNHASWPITNISRAYYLSDNGLRLLPFGNHNGQLAFGPPASPGTTLSYDSPALLFDQTIAGPIGATLYIRSSNTNAHFVLTLFDVAPDGTAVEVSSGGLIASGRELDPDRSWFDATGLATKPEGLYVDSDPLVPSQLYRLDIELSPTLRRIEKGHRLRLVVGTQTDPAKCSLALGLGRPYPCFFTATQAPTLAGGTYQIVSDLSRRSSVNVPLVLPVFLATAESGTTDTSPNQTQPLEWNH